MTEEKAQRLERHRDELRAALEMIEHATGPSPEGDGGFHENAWMLARAALAKCKDGE